MKLLWLLAELRTPFLDKLFLLITELGGELSFIAVAVIVFWCFSKKNGYLLLSVGFLGMVMNQFLKISFKVLRPWDLDPHFEAVPEAVPDAGGFSFPSGHTQNSVGIFGTLATITKKWWVRAICLSLCVIVPFSRMYLGVHTPLDVGFSFFFAIIVIYITRMIFELAYSSAKGMFIFLSSMGAIAVLFLVYVEFIFDPTTLAESQIHNYVSAQKNAYMILGALIGVIISFPIERFLIKFDEKGKWYTQILKVTIGLLLVLGLLNGLKLPLNAILPENTIARAVRYGIVVVFVIAVYPISFKWFRRLVDAIEKRRVAKKYSKDK